MRVYRTRSESNGTHRSSTGIVAASKPKPDVTIAERESTKDITFTPDLTLSKSFNEKMKHSIKSSECVEPTLVFDRYFPSTFTFF